MIKCSVFGGRLSACLWALAALSLSACQSGGDEQPPSPTIIQVTPANPSLPAGSSQQFRAMAQHGGSAAEDVTATAVWTSSNPGVAAFNKPTPGLASAVGKGSATITAAYGGATATAALTVTAASLAGLSVTPAEASLAKGLTQQFKATGTYSDGSTVNLTGSATWKSSTGAATISSSGLATGNSVGRTTITAGAGGRSGSATLNVVDPATPSATIPTLDERGQPIDVGLLVLGHSTSMIGDWPAKLAKALPAAGDDPRTYIVFSAATGGDGGFLWTRAKAVPGEQAYARFEGSQAKGQWCEDHAGARWSCRRTRLVRGLTGEEPAPAECAGDVTGCAAVKIASCVWHDASGKHVQGNVNFHECWRHMDVRLALIQDTSNRSWPVMDFDADGDVDDRDFWPVFAIPPEAVPCPNSTGAVNGKVDWDCDGVLNVNDSPRQLYAQWLRSLAADLLDGFDIDGVDQVYLMHKPVELNGCSFWYADEPGCAPHALRTSTPSRPFDHYYSPSVYWEQESIKLLLADAQLDSRIHGASANVADMWERSAQCYSGGIFASDWSIPGSTGRPDSIAADDSENDADSAAADATGCMISDHIHHAESGGWMMADIWYRGLRRYLGPQ